MGGVGGGLEEEGEVKLCWGLPTPPPLPCIPGSGGIWQFQLRLRGPSLTPAPTVSITKFLYLLSSSGGALKGPLAVVSPWGPCPSCQSPLPCTHLCRQSFH